MIINQLKGIVGEENLSEEEMRKIVHSTDSSMIEGNSTMVLWPTTKEEVKDIVSYSIKRKIQLTVRGGGSGLAGGCVANNEAVVDLTRMNNIIKVDKELKMAIVQPGVVLKNLNDELKELSLFFPVIPGSESVCTIGGMIATNAAGVRAVKYGATKDWIEQITVVTGKGEMITTKNIDDFAGKEGVTGIIVEAILRLAEPLKARTLTMKVVETPEELVKQALEIKKAEGLTALEFFNRKAAQLAGYKPSYYLIAEFESNNGEEKDIAKIEALWKMREGMYPVMASNGYIIVEDPKLPYDKMPEFLKWIDQSEIPCFGHIGLGILHPIFSPEQKNLVKEMFGLVKIYNAEISGEHGIGIAKKEYADKAYTDSIKKLKLRYNKDEVLNRGRIC